jgi:hypothetical protein
VRKKFSVVIIRLRDNVKKNTTHEAKPLLASYIYILEKAGKDASIAENPGNVALAK